MTQKALLNLIIISFLSSLFLLIPVSQAKAQGKTMPTPWGQTPGPTCPGPECPRCPDSNGDCEPDRNAGEEAKEKCKDLDLTGPFTEVDHDQVFKIYDRANQFFGTTVFDREKGVQGYITSLEDRYLYETFYNGDITETNTATYQELDKEKDAVYKIFSHRWISITAGIINPQEEACLKTIAGYGAEIGGTDNPITTVGSLEGCNIPDTIETANQLGDKVSQLDQNDKKQLLRLYLAHAYIARHRAYRNCIKENTEDNRVRDEIERENQTADQRGMPSASGGTIIPIPAEEQEGNPLLYVFKLIIKMVRSWADKLFAVLINWGIKILETVYV